MIGIVQKSVSNNYSIPPLQKVNCRPKAAICFLKRRSRPKAALLLRVDPFRESLSKLFDQLSLNRFPIECMAFPAFFIGC